MSFKTCWIRLIYTKLSSHLSSVMNMYVVTMASPWSFHRSLQRRRKMYIFRYISRFPRSLSKKRQKKRRKPRLNACKQWESESRNRNLSAAVPHVKPSRRNSNLYDSRENHNKVESLNHLISLWYSKWNRDFITINFQEFSLFSGSLSCARTSNWLWALRFISLDNKML